jgi:hypothetical protein
MWGWVLTDTWRGSASINIVDIDLETLTVSAHGVDASLVNVPVRANNALRAGIVWDASFDIRVERLDL